MDECYINTAIIKPCFAVREALFICRFVFHSLRHMHQLKKNHLPPDDKCQDYKPGEFILLTSRNCIIEKPEICFLKLIHSFASVLLLEKKEENL